MRFKLNKFRLKEDFDRIVILHWIHFAIILVITILEARYHSFTSTVLKLVLVGALYRLYFQTVKNLFYTYFSFTVAVYIYLVVSLVQAFFIYPNRTLVDLNIVALIVLSIQCYMLLSPIYFPRVNWWIYDFRYRHDLPITLKIKGRNDQIEGRLTDLRRYAGCVLLFEDLEVGSIIHIDTNDTEGALEAEIMSKHEYSLERGLSYGVKFNFTSNKLKRRFDYFCKYFRKNSKLKLNSNFQK